MKRYLLPALLCLMSAQLFAQTAADVLRYSYLRPGGTGRFLAVSGAMGALGADFGTLSTNPAGLALFRSDELTVTPGLKFAHTDATLPGGSTTGEDRSTFGFDNVGLVFNTSPRASRWKTFNVGIGFNRQSNFNQAIYYQGSAGGSIMNGFFDEANSVFTGGGSEQDLYPFGSGLAWQANAIYFSGNDLSYDFAGFENATVDRSHTLTSYGSMNEMLISFAGNYDEKLMVGLTVGVPFVNYRLEGEYIESDPGGALDGNVPYFDRLSYTELLRTEGIGVNLKLGVIYKVNQMIRLGAAFHTPTSLGLTDSYSNTFQYAYEDGGGKYDGDVIFSPDGTTDYRLRTPWRAIASGGFILNKFGFIGVDVEWVDYGANRYNLNANGPSNESEVYERELNREIQLAYKQAMNIRVGGELALDDFRLRAGVNLNGKPEEGADGFNTAFTLGAGVRGESFFLDLGYRRNTGDGSVQPYAGAPLVTTDNTASDIVLTLGFKF
ncbi:MAG: outer membrane protein transport protein [Saprospiraceae bacterium]|nr:outer membrane protein transport protein [Saprospiraceae bacterium]